MPMTVAPGSAAGQPVNERPTPARAGLAPDCTVPYTVPRPPAMIDADVWPTMENPPGDLQIHVVRATKSDSLDAESLARISEASERTRRVHLHEVDAGHWLNVDNPDALLALLIPHF